MVSHILNLRNSFEKVVLHHNKTIALVARSLMFLIKLAGCIAYRL